MDFVVIIAVIAVLYMAFTRENESGATTPSSPTVSLKPVTISNGRILTYPSYDRVCPLTVSVPSGTNNYYIYLKYIRESTRSIVARERTIHNGTTDDIAFYVEAGKSVNLNVPVGVYRLSYACGETWYGVKEYFGPNTLYYKSDDLLEFYADNQYYNGHTLELWLQSNGNFDRTRINESQFPA